jgi:hypothetical protein
MNGKHSIHIFINRMKFEVENPDQTGYSLKELGNVPLGDVLFRQQPGEDEVIPNDQHVTVKDGDHFHSSPPANYGADPGQPSHIFINRNKYEVRHADQTGQSLKILAAIPLTDVFFRQAKGEDEVIPNDQHVTVKDGDHFHSSPPANYGSFVAAAEGWVSTVGGRLLPQPDGWTFMILDSFALPVEFRPRNIRLLVKIPPGFPDAAPDMFWVQPPVCLPGGVAPNGTSMEVVLAEPWQRFSWHLQPGAWQPGISDMRDFMRCIRSRFERRN